MNGIVEAMAANMSPSPPLLPLEHNLPGRDPPLHPLTPTQPHVSPKGAIISAIKACTLSSELLLGKAVHAQAIKLGLRPDRFVGATLIRFYANFGQLAAARRVFDDVGEKDTALKTAMLTGFIRNGSLECAWQLFDEIPDKDVMAWNAMINGCAQQGHPEEALVLFRKMQVAGIRPNDVTLVGASSACSQLGCLSIGEWIHSYLEVGLPSESITPTLINSLIYMYAKCGELEAAVELFLLKGPQNLETWNTMLSSFAIHGHGTNALSLFSQMIKTGLTPDKITFMSLLMACSHGGLVNHAVCCLNLMSRMYNVRPGEEHYGCLVDVLSRSGRLEEACELMLNLPYEPDAFMMGSLLSGCQAHGEYDLGIEVAKRLIEMEPEEEGRHIALAHLCIMAGRVDEAIEARKRMGEMGAIGSSGSSWIEVDGTVHEFMAGDAFTY